MCSTLKGAYQAEQRTATIKQPTALQWAEIQGTMNRAYTAKTHSVITYLAQGVGGLIG